MNRRVQRGLTQLGPILTANDVEGVAYQRGKQRVGCGRVAFARMGYPTMAVAVFGGGCPESAVAAGGGHAHSGDRHRRGWGGPGRGTPPSASPQRPRSGSC
jgi:hypothetical protein